MQEDKFKEWLPENGVTTDGSMKSYLTYLRNAEKYFGEDMDETIKTALDTVLSKINDQNFPSKNGKVATNIGSGVKKYIKFYLDSQKL